MPASPPPRPVGPCSAVRRRQHRRAVGVVSLALLGAVGGLCVAGQRGPSVLQPAAKALPGAWLGALGPTPRDRTASASLEGAAAEAGRREFWQRSAAAAAAALWTTAPEGAEAFRGDRILNAKKKYIPKIRKYYQDLEGLRDDIYLEIELQTGDANSRFTFASRPADWYDGLDSKMDGPLVLPSDKDGNGCSAFDTPVSGVVLVPRGKCTFVKKVENAKAAGGKSVVLYDALISKQPLDKQGITGAVRSKGIATRSAGDALTGGVSLLPVEKGVTIMGPEKGDAKPDLDAVMISRANGTTLITALQEGKTPRVLDVKRFVFKDGIDLFIKKDLKKMLNEMEIFSNTQRISKDDFADPIIKTLKTDRNAFEAAVKAKDYGAIRSTFASWNSHLDDLGKWDLLETS